MLPHNFIFAVHVVAGEPRFGEMLGEVSAGVLSHAGFAEPVVSALMDELRVALAGAAQVGDEYDLRLRADGGRFHIEVAHGSTSVWRTSRPLP